ncbi:hypothetical protein E8E11_002054 [Didymella keratinophila]|nr:hypothetical protein E8E11_002054 [Didymella keratinophila]
MSFRFSGDFSDRTWTCYLLEDRVEDPKALNLGSRLVPDLSCGINDNVDLEKAYADHPNDTPAQRREKKRKAKSTNFWQQRRFLELLMHSKMLEELYNNTDTNLTSNRRKEPLTAAIEEAQQLEKMGREEEYSTIAAVWRKYIQVLDVAETNLADNLDRIKQWNRRERERENQQPRWTKKDERNYSAHIFKLKILSQRQADKIEQLEQIVEKFRESLPTQLDSIRADVDFLSSQNINLFTYVTVVFLPLGFATGVLSMSGPPEFSVLMNLVSLSLSALGITSFALLNAETAKTFIGPFIDLWHGLAVTLWKLTAAPVADRCHPHAVKPSQTTKHRFFNKLVEPATLATRQPKDKRRWFEDWKQDNEQVMEFSYQAAMQNLRHEDDMYSAQENREASVETPLTRETQGKQPLQKVQEPQRVQKPQKV